MGRALGLRLRRLMKFGNEPSPPRTTSDLELDELKSRIGAFPPGHFYSPLPDPDEIRRDEAAIWPQPTRDLPGVDLNEEGQLQLFEVFKEFYKELPFSETKHHRMRYYFENPAFSYSDAIILYCMMRFCRPRRMIEIGSGYSSCATLDVNDLFFNSNIQTTFIEPYPDLLFSLLRKEDRANIRVIPSRVQDVNLAEFDSLAANDILFVDSTHVSKINSDVNWIMFKVLPRLHSGVVIHFHDVFYPFEYPRAWAFEGRAWNEDYMLRAFLEFNTSFRIMFFSTYLENFYQEVFEEYMPLCLKNKGGSLWIQKL